tara:strand:- start:12093 stop:16493 length:4401 start_codon:yes stop_codon:yes gene_type:complete
MKKYLQLLGTLAMLGLMFAPTDAFASHFRGGTLSYKYISGRTVEVTLEYDYRLNTAPSTAFVNMGGQGTDETYPGGPRANQTSLRFTMTEVSRDTAENAYKWRGTARFTYNGTSTGPFYASYTGCCWLSTMSNAKDASWNLQIKIWLNGNADPEIRSPSFDSHCIGLPYSRNVNAVDPDRDPITYHLGGFNPTNTNATCSYNNGIAVSPCIGFQPPTGMTINQQGDISWPAASVRAGTFAITVRVDDNKGATTYRDFYLKVTPTCPNPNPPTIKLNPSAITVAVGQAACTTATANDPDGNQIEWLDINPVLPAATAKPSGNFNVPATFKYCWTPVKADEGTTHNILFTVRDVVASGRLRAQATFKVTVAAGSPPAIAVSPAGTTKNVDEGKSITFTLKASDPDGNGIDTFTLANLPSFCKAVKKGADEYQITCTPGYNDGTKSYTFQATAKDKDGKPKTTTTAITVKVNDVNRPPTVTNPGTITVEEDKQNKYQVKASDPDGDKLTYSMTGLPATASIDPNTGEIKWTPEQKDVGDHTAKITVTDARGGKTTITVKLTVKNTNDEPVISGTPSKEAEEDKQYTYKPTVTDEDPGDQGKHTWKLKKGPTGAKVDPKTGVVTWTPGDKDVTNGSADFEIEVCDTGTPKKCSTQKWTVNNIKNVNDKPTISGTPPTVAYSGEETTYEPKVNDVDPGDKHTWSIKKGPATASIDPATGKVTWKPGQSEIGKDADFEIEVCDDGTPKQCATQTFKVPVKQKCKVDVECSGKEICAPIKGETFMVCTDPGCADQSPKCSDAAQYCKDGTCGKNACDGVLCAPGEVCRPYDGKCIKPCAGVTCATGEVCMDGACQKEPCAAAGTACKSDEVCDVTTDPTKPTCVKAPCQGGSCKHDRVCLHGTVCIDDPCLNMKCPNRTQRCVAGQCIDRQNCTVDTECPGEEICVNGKCYEPGCHAQGASCGQDQNCIQGECKDDTCKGANPKTCAADEFCRGTDGQCVKPCANVRCPAGQTCTDGKCGADPCASVTCDAGKVCVDGDCEKDNCAGGTACKHGRVCQPSLNTCVTDPCTSVTCPDAKQVCKWGQCEAPPSCTFDNDCPGTQLCVQGKCVIDECGSGCPNGKICQDGKCLNDPCSGVQCKAGSFCKAGTCVGSCAGVFCATGEICIEGKCTSDPCKDKTCGNDEICVEGQCVKNTCKKENCRGTRICQGDKCINDPCGGITCETGHTCQEGQCTGDRTCNIDSECPGESVCIDGKCAEPGCYKEACTDGKLCIKGKCTDDPCSGKNCAEGETCNPVSGQCEKNCPTCDAGDRCVNATCEADPCAGVTCDAGKSCVDGTCKDDVCADSTAVNCKYKRACISGKCQDDPCYGVKCADGSSCKAGVCYEPKKSDPENNAEGNDPDGGDKDGDTQPDTTTDKGGEKPEESGNVETKPLLASGGCTCSTNDGKNPLGSFFALFCFFAVLMVSITRRKK